MWAVMESVISGSEGVADSSVVNVMWAYPQKKRKKRKEKLRVFD